MSMSAFPIPVKTRQNAKMVITATVVYVVLVTQDKTAKQVSERLPWVLDVLLLIQEER